MKVICTVINDLHQDQRMDRICTSLQANGYEVTLVGRQLPNSRPLPTKPYRRYRIACRRVTGKPAYLEYNLRLVRELSGWDYDVICAVDVDTLAAGAFLTRGGRAKLVFDAHEWFHLTPEVTGRPLVRGFWRWLGRRLAPRADLRYTVGPRLAEALTDDYGVPFATVRNLPVRSTVPPAPVPDTKIILYQGMLNPGRGLEVAIQAMDGLPGCELWIAGSGPLEGALRGCREMLMEPGRVKFLGFIDPPDLPALTRKAWLGLNLLEASSPSYYYSLANKAVDYVQAGVPSVQMDFPEYRALQETYGCYVLLESLTAEALIERVAALAASEENYRRLSAACRVAAESLCWEREEKILLGLWARVL